MLWLIFAPAIIYAFGAIIVAIWRSQTPAERGLMNDRELPRIAVLVAARDEEERLPRCLEALIAQNYPLDRITIYVGDDHSTDGTAAVVQSYATRQSGPAIRLVTVPDANGDLRGKASAIHACVEEASEDLLLVTDADCAPPPGWARALVSYFDDPHVGIACGATRIDHTSPEASPLAAEVQALDWTYLLTICGFLVEIGRPVTAMGNNMAFRRAAYQAVGGYPALPFSVTEDYELFRTIVKQTRWKPRFPVDPAIENVTLPLSNAVDMYQQRRRWARGGMKAPAGVYATYALGHLAHLLPVVALFFAPAWALLVLGIRAGADLALVTTALPEERRAILRSFPLWQVYLYLYMITLPYVLLLFPRIDWKNRKL